MMLETVSDQAVLTTVEVVIGAIVGTLISTAVTKWKEHKTIEDKLEELAKAIESTRSEFKAEINNVRAELMYEIEGLKEAQSSELRNTIRHICLKSIEKGYISLDVKHDLLSLVDSYERIVKNNGVIDDIVRRTRELPNDKPEG